MKNFQIPTHWTTDQALIVLDLLEDLHRTVWDCYENRAVEAIIRELDEAEHADDANVSPAPHDPQKA